MNYKIKYMASICVILLFIFACSSQKKTQQVQTKEETVKTQVDTTKKPVTDITKNNPITKKKQTPDKKKKIRKELTENPQNKKQNYNSVTKETYRIGAICRDGTRSYATGRGACSHHGGVSYWLYK